MIDSEPAGTRPAPWDYAAPWGARGYITDLDGPVHWIEFTADKSKARITAMAPIKARARAKASCRSCSCTAWAART